MSTGCVTRESVGRKSPSGIQERSPSRGLGSGDPEADDIIWKMTIANIVSRDHCIKILAEWMD